jgi:aminodeoxyfutalosine deaminase
VKILLASLVAPMVGPAIRDGGVAVEGERALAVGGGREIRSRHAGAEMIDLGDAVLLPGLVNAHVHLEMTNVPRPQPAPAFVDWILAVRKWMSGVGDLAEFARESTLAGVEQCFRFGVTAVGDVTLNSTITRPLLARRGMRGVSFGEVLGMAGRAGQLEGRLAAAVDTTGDGEWLKSGIEPHAPYSLDLHGYRRCVEEARARGMPLATHLAETPDEGLFLSEHAGEFRRLWESLAAWKEGVSREAGGPIRVMKRLGLLEHWPAVLAHVNYLDDDELDVLAGCRASVVYCPRTHAYFGHWPHRFREMVARGINVAIGTDSCASSQDLNPVEDLRLVHRLHPEMPAAELFEMVTARAAAALGMAGRFGAITPGAAADFCVFPALGEDSLLAILESDVLPRELWMGGERVFARKSTAS